MATRANCGLESADAFRFCPACAAPLDQGAAPARRNARSSASSSPLSSVATKLDDLDAARALAEELLPTVGVGARLDGLIELVWVAGRIGVAEDLRGRLSGLEPASSLWLKAGREILDEEFAQAAEAFAEIGCPPDEAEARLRDAEALVRAGRRSEADAQLARALSFYRSVGVTRYVRRAEQLLAETG